MMLVLLAALPLVGSADYGCSLRSSRSPEPYLYVSDLDADDDWQRTLRPLPERGSFGIRVAARSSQLFVASARKSLDGVDRTEELGRLVSGYPFR